MKSSKSTKRKTTKTDVLEVEAGEVTIKLQESLKRNSYEASIGRIRKHLGTISQRTFSKFIHAKSMDEVNDFLGRTIAIPSCILGGAILALIGSGIGIYLSKYYGYSYNYLLLVVFFIAGYIISAIIKLIAWWFIK